MSNIPTNSPKPTPEQQSAATQKAIDTKRDEVASSIAAQAVATGISAADLEKTIEKILDERKTAAVEKLQPKEPDYKTLNEEDIYSSDVYIPVIEHDIPDYMNMKLRDQEYVAVWANRDQRRLGTLLAEGYEFLRPEHVHPDFKILLKFSSENLYEYADVVCLRVHKRIRFAKLRRIQQASENQLRPAAAQENAKAKLMESLILGDPALDAAFASGASSFYSPKP